MGWAVALIEFFMTEQHKLWKQCNDNHHAHEEMGVSGKKVRDAIGKARAMYAMKDRMLAVDRDILAGTLEDRIAEPGSALTANQKELSTHTVLSQSRGKSTT